MDGPEPAFVDEFEQIFHREYIQDGVVALHDSQLHKFLDYVQALSGGRQLIITTEEIHHLLVAQHHVVSTQVHTLEQ